MERILVVVDMQNDFIDGVLGTKEAQNIIDNVCEKIRTFDGEILVTLDTHETDYLNTLEGVHLPVEHCIKDTEGWRLQKDVQSALSEKEAAGCKVAVFEKPTFGSTNLANYLAKQNADEPIDKITLIGVCTDICVVSNAILLKAVLPEVKLTVDAACCAGVTPEKHLGRWRLCAAARFLWKAVDRNANRLMGKLTFTLSLDVFSVINTILQLIDGGKSFCK